MFFRIQKLTISIYVNINVMQGLVNREKPCVLFFNKTKFIIKTTRMWTTWEYFWFLEPLCTRGSMISQFANLDMEKNLQYIFTSNKTLVIFKLSKKYTNNIASLSMYWRWAMTSYFCSISFGENYTNYRPRDTMMTK